jgi:hypothetical protein
VKTLLTAILLTLGATALAQTAELQKVGEARLKVLFWPIYDSRLFSADGTYQPGKPPLRLEIQYLRDIESKDLVERTAAEWQAQQLFHPNQQEWLETLSRIWPDVAENDVISLELRENLHSHFYVNNTWVGSIEDPAFGQQFLDIWLSPQTTRPEIRQQLLGRS